MPNVVSAKADAARTEPVPLPLGGLLALSTAAFTAVLTELLPAGLLPQMSAALGVTEGRVGFLVSAYAAASVLAAIPVTAALRGLPRRAVLLGVLAVFAAANTVTALSSAYPLTAAARLLAGAAGGTMWAMLAGYAARMVPADRRGRAIAIVLAGITVALALGVPAGTALAGMVGWRAGFALLAVAAVLLIGWVRWRVPTFPGAPPADRMPVRRVGNLPGLRPVLSVTLLLLVGHQVMYTYVGPFADQAGFGRTSLVLSVFGVATVGGVWLAGALADRHLRPALLGTLAVITVAMAAIGVAGHRPAALLAAAAGWGVAFGAAPTLIQTALVDAASPAHADPATAMQATVYNLGIAGGALAGGLILDGGGTTALPWVTLILVTGALGVVALARRHAFPVDRPAR